MDNGALFDTPEAPGGVQTSNEKNIFDFSLCLFMIQTFFGQWNSQFQFAESDVWSNQSEKCYYPYLEAVIRHF